MNRNIVIIMLVFTAALIGGFVYLASPKEAPRDLTALAQCLAEKEVTMYGAYWCSHCQRQKKMFGEAFQYVPYVECTVETQKCLDLKIDGYPTWLWPDGKRIEGEVSAEKLAEESQCAI